VTGVNCVCLGHDSTASALVFRVLCSERPRVNFAQNREDIEGSDSVLKKDEDVLGRMRHRERREAKHKGDLEGPDSVLTTEA